MLTGAIPVVLLIATAPWLFVIIFGSEWQEAGRYCQLLGIGFLVRFMATPLSQTLTILERQELQLAWDVLRVVVVLSTITMSY